MEVLIDYEYLSGIAKEPVVKELAIAAKDVVQTFHFKSPYHMQNHGSEANGLNWSDGIIPYDDLQTVVSDAVANYPHVYAYGADKCAFLSDLLKRPVLNIADFNCPAPENFVDETRCWMPCHKFPNVSCAASNAHAFYKWLTFHLQAKAYVKCPKENARHTAQFLSAI